MIFIRIFTVGLVGLAFTGCQSAPQREFSAGRPVEIEHHFFVSKLIQDGFQIQRSSFDKGVEDIVGPDDKMDSAYWYRAPAIAFLIGGPLLVIHGGVSSLNTYSPEAQGNMAAGAAATLLGALLLKLANNSTEDAADLYNKSLDPNPTMHRPYLTPLESQAESPDVIQLAYIFQF